MKSSAISRLQLLANLLVTTFFVGGCTQLPPSSPNQAAAAQVLVPTDRSQYRYLYAVYCNGTVDRLDLVRREKVGSFQLAQRSGNPPAVAALPLPGFSPHVCLARPVTTSDANDQNDGVVHLVASAQFDSDHDSNAEFQLLTFSLPDWTLQRKRDLGRRHFGRPPRLLRTTDGYLVIQPDIKNPDGSYVSPQSPGSDPWAEMADLVRSYTGGEKLSWTKAIEWSAGNVVLDYGLSEGRPGIALANKNRHQIVRVFEQPSGTMPPLVHLAPGGEFALLVMQRDVSFIDGGSKVENTGELRLYNADGQLVRVLTEPGIEGQALAVAQAGKPDDTLPHERNDWWLIALTPEGLAVFVKGWENSYRFVDLGQKFGVEPVINAQTDDWDGYLPGLVYAGQ